MIELLIVAVLAIGIAAVDVEVGSSRRGRACGLGSIAEVVSGKAQNPMQGRPLIPELCVRLGGNPAMVYVIIKSLGHVCAGLMAYAAMGYAGAVSVLALIATGIQYDYPCSGWEAAGICLMYWCLDHQQWIWVAMPAIVVWVGVRESAIFGPIILACSGQFAWGAVGASLWLAGRLWVKALYGNPPSYVNNMPKVWRGLTLLWNLSEIPEVARMSRYAFVTMYPFVSISMTAMCLVVSGWLVFAYGFDWMTAGIVIPAIAMCFAAWLRGRTAEPRIFVPAIIPLIYGFTKLHGGL